MLPSHPQEHETEESREGLRAAIPPDPLHPFHLQNKICFKKRAPLALRDIFLLSPGDTQQLGRQRPLPCSLPMLRLVPMAMTSPLGTELSQKGVPATLALVPFSSLCLPAREGKKPRGLGQSFCLKKKAIPMMENCTLRASAVLMLNVLHPVLV